MPDEASTFHPIELERQAPTLTNRKTGRLRPQSIASDENALVARRAIYCSCSRANIRRTFSGLRFACLFRPSIATVYLPPSVSPSSWTVPSCPLSSGAAFSPVTITLVPPSNCTFAGFSLPDVISMWQHVSKTFISNYFLISILSYKKTKLFLISKTFWYQGILSIKCSLKLPSPIHFAFPIPIP